jgi:hypothetical protein
VTIFNKEETFMAKVKKNFLAIPAGKVGDVVFKTWKGEPYVATKPSGYRKKDTEHHGKVSSAFLLNNGFCSTLNKISTIKAAWNDAENNAYRNMNSCNLKKLRNGGSFETLSLLPFEPDFELPLMEVDFSERKLVVTPETYPGIFSAGEKYLSLHGILFLEDPVDKNNEAYSYIPINSSIQNINDDGLIVENIFFSADTEVIKMYRSRKVLLNFSVKDKNGELVKFSKTIFRDLTE